MKAPTLLELLQAGVHFGHRESRWHPKMQEFIFGSRGGVHIIDLEKTLVRLEEAKKYVRDLVGRGGTVLILGTKKQAAPIVKKYAEEVGAPYVTSRWLGGTLTNYKEVMGLVRRYKELVDMRESGEMAKKYTKKERVRFDRQIIDAEEKIGGIKDMNRLPDAIFIVDVVHEKTALLESGVKKIPVIALADTNVNPDRIAYPIPSNDDAVKTIELMVTQIADAIKEGKELQAKTAKASSESNGKSAEAPKEAVRPEAKTAKASSAERVKAAGTPTKS